MSARLYRNNRNPYVFEDVPLSTGALAEGLSLEYRVRRKGTEEDVPLVSPNTWPYDAEEDPLTPGTYLTPVDAVEIETLTLGTVLQVVLEGDGPDGEEIQRVLDVLVADYHVR